MTKSEQRRELKRRVAQVYNAANKLSQALHNLSFAAIDIYGEDLQADLCNGGEIEFRKRGKDGYFDAFSCIRLEDIEAKLP